VAIEITSGDILSPEQLTTHLRVFAGPGAGKTHFLVENVKSIVETHPFVAKSFTRKVLCVTYTNAAVEEIQRRLDRYSSSVEVFTIHGFIIEHIIKPFQKDLHNIISEEFGIDVGDRGIISSQIEGLGILHGVEKEDIYEFINDNKNSTADLSYTKKEMSDVQVNIAHYLEHSSDDGFKACLSAPDKISQNHILPIKKYIWSKVRKLTHDEILYFGYRILECNSTALYATRVKFPFVFVDEFQDTNPLQTKLIKLLGEKSTIVGVIGDSAQSIYSFQGAKPGQFLNLTMDSAINLTDYTISGNRRSTSNIVEFCNFIRKSDTTIVQKSIKTYVNSEAKAAAESKPIHFLVGDNDHIRQIISGVIEDGGAILTRSWAKAFTYIRGIDEEQVKLLKDIYNSYYRSPIDIRAEITEIGNVTWVRAFNFIFSLYDAYTSGSFIDAYNAFRLYTDIDRRRFNVKLLLQIKSLADETFEGLVDTTSTVTIIEKLNSKINDTKYTLMRISFLGDDFEIPVFDEYDLTSGSKRSEKFIKSLRQLNWATSHKLFKEVFSKESHYMTVHQAKGLEWDKVVVSVEPSKSEEKEITLCDIYSNPQILQETSAEEFVRMYYVACSRAREDLYIHLPADFDISLIPKVFRDASAYEIIQ